MPEDPSGIAPGRYADFENGGDDDDLGAMLRPRSRRTSPTANPATTEPGPDVGGEVESTPAAQTAPSPDTSPAPAAPRRTRASRTVTPADREAPPVPPTPVDAAAQVARGPIKGSTIHLPPDLVTLVVAAREASGRSNGDILIAALEQDPAVLSAALSPRGTVGGSRFRPRGVYGRSGAAAPDPVRGSERKAVKPMNIRLYDDDYATIDDMVTEFGARSRSHLATAALTALLQDPETDTR